MSFEWPWQYNFPPFFTLQPNVDTRQKQLAAWCSLVLSFCRQQKLYTLDVLEAQESPVFNNKKIQRKLSVEAIQVVFEELRKKGNLEWLDKNKSRCLIMWRRPEEWGKLIYQWVSKNGMVNSVFTLYELSNGEDTEKEEFHGLEDWMLLRSLQALQADGKAEIITMDDGKAAECHAEYSAIVRGSAVSCSGVVCKRISCGYEWSFVLLAVSFWLMRGSSLGLCCRTAVVHARASAEQNTQRPCASEERMSRADVSILEYFHTALNKFVML
ncbi:hypothetical protein QQF64_004128 [Cirrhinus molitorella]|uniref:Vacuolar protein-sorting-associated protein 25 n=1 Tax=Cirrhinus molitorella TaxID=172907 RepID=A0ABR3MFA1_9TELE